MEVSEESGSSPKETLLPQDGGLDSFIDELGEFETKIYWLIEYDEIWLCTYFPVTFKFSERFQLCISPELTCEFCSYTGAIFLVWMRLSYSNTRKKGHIVIKSQPF